MYTNSSFVFPKNLAFCFRLATLYKHFVDNYLMNNIHFTKLKDFGKKANQNYTKNVFECSYSDIIIRILIEMGLSYYIIMNKIILIIMGECTVTRKAFESHHA